MTYRELIQQILIDGNLDAEVTIRILKRDKKYGPVTHDKFVPVCFVAYTGDITLWVEDSEIPTEWTPYR
jgi:hypothetical protein